MTPDIVLVICDTARADAFKPWGGPFPSPSLQRACREGVAYRNAISAAPWTLPSTVSMMSGQLPTEHGIHNECVEWSGSKPTSPARALRNLEGDWLPEVLGLRGYATWAASCNAWVSKWGGFERGFAEFHEMSDRVRLPSGAVSKYLRKLGRLAGKIDRGGQATVAAFARRAGSSDPRPLFAFLNLMEVHTPYNPPRPFYPFPPWKRRKTFEVSGSRFLRYSLGLEECSQEFVQTFRSLYWHSARYEDSLLGQIVDAVEERGRPCVVVFTSDHGENIGDHGLFGHTSSLHETLLHVPLVIWGYRLNIGPGWVEDTVSTRSLAAWLRGVADGDAENVLTTGPCISEYESTARRISPETLAELEATGKANNLPPLIQNAGVAIHDGGTKYVALETGREYLYDLSTDPQECNNLSGGRSGDLERFRPLRDAWLARRGTQPTHEVGEAADLEIAAHLRELGYID